MLLETFVASNLAKLIIGGVLASGAVAAVVTVISLLIKGLVAGTIIFLAYVLTKFIGKRVIQAYKKHARTKKAMLVRLKRFVSETKEISINDLNDKYDEDDVLIFGIDEAGEKTEEEKVIHKEEIGEDLRENLDSSDGALVVSY